MKTEREHTHGMATEAGQGSGPMTFILSFPHTGIVAGTISQFLVCLRKCLTEIISELLSAALVDVFVEGHWYSRVLLMTGDRRQAQKMGQGLTTKHVLVTSEALGHRSCTWYLT